MHARLGPCVLLISQEQRLLDALDAGFRARWPEVEILTALDSATGLQLARDCQLGLVVLDGDHGERARFETLASSRRLAQVPVVLLTDDGRWPHESRTPEPEVDFRLHKPFSTLELMRLAGRILTATNAAALTH